MSETITAFLESLFKVLDQSVIDYKAYLSAGKTFRYAQVLKINNGKALTLLIENAAQLPEAQKEDAAAMIEHYTVWTRKWEELAASLQPGAEDVFVFPNTVTFPRESVARLQAFYETLTRS